MEKFLDFLLEFDMIYGKMNSSGKEFMQTFVRTIVLYSEKDSGWCIINQIRFKLMVYYNGGEGDTIRLLNENIVERIIRLEPK